MAKLTNEQKTSIIFDWRTGTDSMRTLAKKYGVAHSAIAYTVKNHPRGEASVVELVTRKECSNRGAYAEFVSIDKVVILETDTDMDIIKKKVEWYADAGMKIASKAMGYINEEDMSLAKLNLLADVLSKCMKITGTVAFYPSGSTGFGSGAPLNGTPLIPEFQDFYNSLRTAGSGTASGETVVETT